MRRRRIGVSRCTGTFSLGDRFPCITGGDGENRPEAKHLFFSPNPPGTGGDAQMSVSMVSCDLRGSVSADLNRPIARGHTRIPEGAKIRR
jgi:hypothetical protein